MSTKKSILRQLERLHSQEGSDRYLPPGSLEGFDRSDSKHTAALNELLQARLIRGTTGSDGTMEVALSPHRLSDVRKMLRPWHLRPALWASVAVVVGAAALFLSVV